MGIEVKDIDVLTIDILKEIIIERGKNHVLGINRFIIEEDLLISNVNVVILEGIELICHNLTITDCNILYLGVSNLIADRLEVKVKNLIKLPNTSKVNDLVMKLAKPTTAYDTIDEMIVDNTAVILNSER